MKKFILLLTLVVTNLSFAQPGTVCWREISAGKNFSMAIRNDGTLWAWGLNGNLLGLNGNMANQNAPIQVGTANDWKEVSAGANHTLALKTNGTLWSWGDGLFGQLGNGLFNSATWTVTQVGTATDWLHVSAGNRFSIALKNNGTLWSWGYNSVGQLGQNNLTNLNIPTQVGTSTNWSAIDAGEVHSLALDAGGFLYAWGDNTAGQFGNASNTSSLVPVPSTTSTWGSISAGFDHSLLLDPAGNMFAMGGNTNGQLGDGSNTASNVPLLVGISSAGIVGQYIAISAGNTFSLAIRNDNTLHSTGMNNMGQLGLSNNTNTNSFNQVGLLNTWQKISAGDVHSLAMEVTANLWASGRNVEGQLGIANNTNSNFLQQVGCTPSTAAIAENGWEENELVLFPNPVDDKLNIEFPFENVNSIEISVINLQGKIVSTVQKSVHTNFSNIEINLSDLPSGIYFLYFQSNGQQWNQRFEKR